MAKITFADKSNLHPPWDEEYQITADNINEVKASTNDLYDIVGAGTVSDNLVVVSINTGGATNKIKDTLDAIIDSSANKPYLVQVRPGAGTLAYVEDNFTVPPFVSLISDGSSAVTEIQGNATTGIQISMSDGSQIEGFKISGKSSGTCISATNTGTVTISKMVFEDCSYGITINNASLIVYLRRILFVESVTGVSQYGINIIAGNVTLNDLWLSGDGTVGVSLVHTTSSDAILTASNISCFSSNAQAVIIMEDGSRANLFDVAVVNAYDGLIMSGGSVLTSNNIKMVLIQNDGFRSELGTGGTTEVTFSGCLFSAQAGGRDVNITDANFKATGGPLEMSIEESYVHPSAELFVHLYNTFAGDESSTFISEVHVGSPSRPSETVLGEGDSHALLLAYSTTDDIIYTNITDDVKSSSGSTFTFPSTSTGASIYLTNLYNDPLGTPLPFYGIKTIVNTAAVLGAGNFTVQIYNTISGWIDVDYMETQADRRFYQYAKNIFSHTGDHQIRGPIRLQLDTNPSTRWDISDPPTTGTNRYWARIRIASTITTAPIFEQFKLHTNRFEVNSDGWIEYFGTARPQASLPVTIGAGRELAGNMGNANIWIDNNLGEGLVDNQFSAITQYFGFASALPDDLDTGSGVRITLTLRGSAAGTVNLSCDYGLITEGSSAYTSNPGLIPIPSRKTATGSCTFTGINDIRYLDFDLDVTDFRARKDPADGTARRDIIFITINPTSLPVVCQLITIQNYYFSWCSGGHI